MFGKRKGPTSPSEPSAPQLPEAAFGGATGAATAGTGTPAKPAASANPAPVAQGSGPQSGGSAKPRRGEGRLAPAVEGRKLVVGREICLSGEIKTCEKLVVEGQVEADLRDSHSLEISEPGRFKGHATVEDCEISGTFEGELIVTGLLVITPTGRVSGKIRYADMEIARGARLSGDIDALDEATLRRLRGDGPKLAHDSATAGPGGKSRIG
ncbi:polymer-forming cytoskeletal protein [Pelagibius sp. 7325]|uniref:bactofilin family protein n=1 Tax=Pelagibius sp. 7325 TaxID=3131994 RepID=UPI0030ED3283